MRQLQRWGVVAALVCPGTAAMAYGEAGHFHSAMHVLSVGDATLPEHELVAFCSQLPDLAEDLDAVSVYTEALTYSPVQWWKWANDQAVNLNDRNILNMITVQQLLHALTGGSANAVRAAGDQAVNTLAQGLKATPQKDRKAADLCALGFALHFRADAAAHRQLRKPDQMYATGWGHGNDLSYPDRPLCDGPLDAPQERLPEHCVTYPLAGGRASRTEAWRDTWQVLGQTLAPGGNPLNRLWSAVKAEASHANDHNDWAEAKLTKLLQVNRRKGAEYQALFDSERTWHACEKVLRRVTKTVSTLTPYASLTCADAWKAYAPAISSALNADRAARQLPLRKTDPESLRAIDNNVPLLNAK